MKLKTFIATAVLLAVLAPAAAFAATDVHATGVDLRPLLQEILLTVASVVGVLGLWALRAVGSYIKARTGVNVLAQEDAIRTYLESALQSGLKYASTQVDKAKWAEVDTKNEILNIAASYVLDAVPDALAYFKLDRDGVLARLQARFPDLELTLAQTAPTGSVAKAAK